ncbi:manganese efflux pump [Undibacterium seohonense]|uniref:Putative manganese efflux pump MntP n=1 Tax=Undibacterium seohonense TaxID=1344950 RepID=A0ABR6X2V0_9BURK|nr:manganese efflux pump MntP family protein [Undibacterium seohonense]MBC3807116.1 manganese efflux pump [Undibacterium seohonense]
MIEVIILALALSMDAFAVSIGLGAKKNVPNLALRVGLFFGLFQALMPFFGYWGGRGVFGWVAGYTHWIAFGLLVVIGAKMIYEGLQEGIEEDIAQVTNKMLLTLAIATSIDAMAAGFSLNLLAVNPYLACVIIGVITFAFSVVGVIVGKRSGTWLESKAEIFGGTVLILMGIKFLVF